MKTTGYTRKTPPRGHTAHDSFARDAEIEQLVDKIGAGGLTSVQNYKRSVLSRRLRRCLLDTNCPPEDFAKKLGTDPDARAALQRALQINVSGFFRDPEAWTHLQRNCLAPLVAQSTPGATENSPIRAWSAGCATGEEAYSLAIAVAELLPEPESVAKRLKVYATDIDRTDLEEARKGTYSEPRMKEVSDQRVERFFQTLGYGRATIDASIRSAVVFGGLNLLLKPPIPRLDLIICRNVLIYFDREGQSRVMDKFRFALRPGGYLFLGPAECIATEPEAFRTVSAEHRIFQRED
jgi:two-component system, chemotaxis family, CheB/CheR fusion protein